MAESTAARRLVMFQPNVAQGDRRLAAVALTAMKMMTRARRPSELSSEALARNAEKLARELPEILKTWEKYIFEAQYRAKAATTTQITPR